MKSMLINVLFVVLKQTNELQDDHPPAEIQQMLSKHRFGKHLLLNSKCIILRH